MAESEEEVLALALSGLMFKQGKLSVSKISLIWFLLISFRGRKKKLEEKILWTFGGESILLQMWGKKGAERNFALDGGLGGSQQERLLMRLARRPVTS